jgi:hypothetical protein
MPPSLLGPEYRHPVRTYIFRHHCEAPGSFWHTGCWHVLVGWDGEGLMWVVQNETSLFMLTRSALSFFVTAMHMSKTMILGE